MTDSKDNLSSTLKKTKDKIKEIQKMNIDEEDKSILISSYITKYKKYKEKLLEKKQHSSKSLKNESNIIENFFNFPKIMTEFNNFNEITSNIHPQNNKSYSYSYSSSTSSSLDPEGKTIVHQKETKNKNGKVTTLNNCYEIDSNGHKKIINCDKKENFEKIVDIHDNEDSYIKNDYGKKIKFNYKK